MHVISWRRNALCVNSSASSKKNAMLALCVSKNVKSAQKGRGLDRKGENTTPRTQAAKCVFIVVKALAI